MYTDFMFEIEYNWENEENEVDNSYQEKMYIDNWSKITNDNDELPF